MTAGGGLFQAQTPVQWAGNFLEGFIGQKPLFSGGVQIGNWSVGGGYFDTNAQDVMRNVCSGSASLFSNITAQQADPATWTTYDDWENPISVQDYCLQKAVVPSWVDQSTLNNYVQTTGGSIVPLQTQSLTVPLAVAAGILALSLFMIARR